MPLRFRQKLQVLGQQNSDKRCPNLNPNRIFAGADERFDLEVLLEHLEKAFDLPASLIDVPNRLCVQLGMIATLVCR